jgi:hypothetical protein
VGPNIAIHPRYAKQVLIINSKKPIWRRRLGLLAAATLNIFRPPSIAGPA